jgi:cell division protein FtsL
MSPGEPGWEQGLLTAEEAQTSSPSYRYEAQPGPADHYQVRRSAAHRGPDYPVPDHPVPDHPVPDHPVPEHPVPAHHGPEHPVPAHPVPAHHGPEHHGPERRDAERQDREEQRRHLRLVQNQARRRAGRRRLLVVLGIASVAAVCLSLVGLHVLIAENQFTLDNLQQNAATEQAKYEKLRLQVAELEAPARIVSQAEGRLRMVQPASITYLPAPTSADPRMAGGDEVLSGVAGRGRGPQTSTTEAGDPPTTAGDPSTTAGDPPTTAGDPPTTGTVTAPQGDSDWPTVKPYLSGSP